ncbi:MAG: tetratricopeptide repeat protein [Acidobacteria bacterium]|nr:tetratricopeptide repeat protein [Acidobacteriota bacterium]
MVRILRFAIIALFISVGMSLAQTQAPTAAGATGWKGKSRMGGTVGDEAGKPVPGVTIKFVFLPTNDGPPDVVTTAKGEWKVENIAEGMWSLEFWKDGLDPRQIPVQVGGKVREPFITVKMTKEGTDPTFAIRTGAAKAQAFFDQKKFSESRAVFQGLLAKYPTVYQLRQYIARDYHMEKNYEKAIGELQAYLKDVPADRQVKMMLATELLEAGKGDEAWAMFSTFDTTVLTDALDLETPGFALLRAKKPVEALKYFERVVVLYPDDPQAYYYRGLTYFQIGVTTEKPNTPEAKAKFEAAKADLTKFLAMVPDAEKNTSDPNNKNAIGAKQMLAEIK